MNTNGWLPREWGWVCAKHLAPRCTICPRIGTVGTVKDSVAKSGQASDCNSDYVGSNPTRVSK